MPVWRKNPIEWITRRAACVLLGHEKWIELNDDWSCMRCGRSKHHETPSFPARPSADVA